jgi:hypothetical protein
VWGALKVRSAQVALPRRRSTRAVLVWLTQAGWITGWSYRGSYVVVHLPARYPPGRPNLTTWNRRTSRLGFASQPRK